MGTLVASVIATAPGSAQFAFVGPASIARVKCPYCAVEFHASWKAIAQLDDKNGSRVLHWVVCAACERGVLKSTELVVFGDGVTGERMLLPRGALRPVPPEVPPDLASIFVEANLTLPDSPRASAALSRRALQQLLVDHAGAPKGDLHSQIEWVLANGRLPSHLEESLHAVRAIGNIGAHTQKSLVTGDIVDVEPGEADWNLDTLEGLFDHYFTQPGRTAARLAALNAKQQEIGKPPLP